MRLTGERPMRDVTPDSLLAFHDAGYREVVERLGAGIVLDVGCGVGEQTARLTGRERTVIGADYDAATAVGAGAEWGRGGRRGSDVRFTAMDGARLGLRDRSVDWVCSSHIIEHFVAPEAHVAELARVSRSGGTAFVITPNAPADFENPFHVYLFEAKQLESMLLLFFEDVEVFGLEGDDEIKGDFAQRRRSGERILKLDRFELRKKIPRRAYVWSYTRALPVVYRLLGSSVNGVGSGLDASHFSLTPAISDATPGLFAVARSPRASVAALPRGEPMAGAAE
ncbi:MAG: class I SAM-dependent methyltransferase [Actinobacteria bacterium]|nr:class I SAM-dependent methyltransferase [Actinomycetota bacterium]